jgi:peptidoglycan/xylan/chitin deacetylase (PgdA/CDA1 family)
MTGRKRAIGRMAGPRDLLRWCRAGLLRGSGALRWAEGRLRQEGAIVVLAFHRVLGDVEFERTYSLPGMCIRRRTFAELMAHLVRSFDVVNVSQALPGERSGRLRVAFTFDDGWLDTCTTAYPVAQMFGVSITVFLCPKLAGKDLPFWPERVTAAMQAGSVSMHAGEIEGAIERMKLCTPAVRSAALSGLAGVAGPATPSDGPDRTLSLQQMAEMDAAGVVFGAHTQNHEILTSIPEGSAREEIEGSKNALEELLGRACELFAYPNGSHSCMTRRLVAGAGFSRAFTTERAAWTAQSDNFAIPRVNVSESDVAGPNGRFSAAMFAYNVFWKAWRARGEGTRRS